MTQRSDKIEDMFEVMRPPVTARPIRLLKEGVREEALARIGYFVTTKRRGEEVDRWAVLNWFVQLANEDLATLPSHKLTQKLAEYLALEQEAVLHFESGRFNNDPLSSDNLIQLQSTVKQNLDQLISKGSLEAGPFNVVLWISLPSYTSVSEEEHRLRCHEHYLKTGNEALIYVMSRCLGHFGDRLRKCPYCETLFLQKRSVRSKHREGTYCSASCRTLYGRRQKKQANATQAKGKDKKRHPGDLETKRRAVHGKKRR